jgi:phosphoribosylaminoimidazolecarboxamide formyltransferase/IMP cyclohydrolase
VRTVRRALLSAADKTGLIDLAQALRAAGAEIVSTGGTAAALRAAGLPVRPLDQVTGFPELLGGRVKTLHPAVHAGLLARESADDLAQLREHGITPIDLVAVTLYPFEEAIADGAAMDRAVEEVDIGGVALLRAAAKNWARVAVLCVPRQYPDVIAALAAGGIPDDLRLRLAAEAFARVAAYDAAIAAYFQQAAGQTPFPDRLTLTFRKHTELRYGENPHQRAALYAGASPAPGEVLTAQVHGGRALSYNNIADLEAAWALARDLPQPSVAVIKHLNPCGAAAGETVRDAFVRARDGDPTSAFGGVVAANAVIDAEAAQTMGELFLECVIAPGYTPEALAALGTKRNLRLLTAVPPTGPAPVASLDFRSVRGGMLIQDPDAIGKDMTRWRVVTERRPSEMEWTDLRFAWAVCAHVKSNAIVFVKDRQVVGVGAGQMSRVDSVRLAASKAGERARDAVAASDAFFPFADGVEAAAAAGVTAVVQPGGSLRDAEVLAAANRLRLTMVTTGERHFRH